MAKDILLLLQPGFEDGKFGEGAFVCPHCNQIEGLLRSFPSLGGDIDVRRLPFPRPRPDVIALIGEDNQGLPALILDGNPPADAKSFGEVHFINDTKRILELLAERHGFPRLH